ncbi:RagB/SusD family nutrient uptake outer membrane protein [Sphingobacterium yanglingense]|uniref:SusD-like starch-binding protein associating with outer membrane n=1 Tax=Sphingobacterium yanglingense TaxID=1437280 RepID=A0A4R6W8E5_9SPHI|nr:RagB/SusD family nutrient uptake outer membrane protein [Sphingobacterium yanglingense]TDQ73821.1 SusD-like starch-binding protein associating with outer membrane [Sphingobacterium yanglingense]
MKAKLYLITITILLQLSCSDDFLNEKPRTSLVVPQYAADYWALLDNVDIMQFTLPLGHLSSDEYYYQTATWKAQSPTSRNSYIWAKDIYENDVSAFWNRVYQQIFYANCVLEGIEINRKKINDNEYNLLKGSALFSRAYAFFNAVQTFAMPYNVNTAQSDLGIPLRLSPDLSIVSKRSTIQECYDQIFNDLLSAIELVPTQISDNRSRPNKPAVLALLSRIYLSMAKYDMASKYAEDCLLIYNQLLDFKTLNLTASTPFTRTNPEVIYYSFLHNISIDQNMMVDEYLLSLYHLDDLRKPAFFRSNLPNAYYANGSYTHGSRYHFSGLAVDEVMLNLAECYARDNELGKSMEQINRLLRYRYKKDGNGNSTYTDQTANDRETAINIVLAERRKELIFRGIRWLDLRRLNQEAGRETTLSRTIDGQTYTLSANSPNYALPIPQNEINISGIQQNQRN